MDRTQAENRLVELVAALVARNPPTNRSTGTAIITEAVGVWLRDLGAHKVVLEVKRDTTALGLLPNGRGGRYDAVGVWKSGARLVIEIDATQKLASLAKLRDAREDGDRVLWIRWFSGAKWARIVRDIPVLWLDINAMLPPPMQLTVPAADPVERRRNRPRRGQPVSKTRTDKLRF